MTYAVVSYTMSINVESKFTKNILYSVPPEDYGIEVK